jgi:hypothetical protein
MLIASAPVVKVKGLDGSKKGQISAVDAMLETKPCASN